jgi:phospholipid-transporting ATPase
LRTLLIAKKELDEAWYEKWTKKYHNAMTSINKEKEMNIVAEELEVDFDLVGSTAIEDKLQEDVGRTIHDIKRAGIKVWVLTGDKVETAINIGFSCRLLSNDMNMFIIKETEPKRIRIELVNLLAQQNITRRARENAVIVAGDSLLVIQREESLMKEFVELCSQANVVLACRVSPKQKAEVVRMMRAKEPNKSTLAIGDGANDVNMITAAHIGIGIAGLEGTQAARASDYSIGQFRFLRSLLFTHGRECYRRNTYLVSYMFYKNVLYVMPIFIYGFLSKFSGTVIYDAFMYQLYNVIFTGVPIIWFAVFDWEFDKAQLMRQPKLYQAGLDDLLFNVWVFWRWFGYAVWQGVLLCYLSFYNLDQSPHPGTGKLGCMANDGNFIFGTLVIVVNLKVLVSAY